MSKESRQHLCSPDERPIKVSPFCCRQGRAGPIERPALGRFTAVPSEHQMAMLKESLY